MLVRIAGWPSFHFERRAEKVERCASMRCGPNFPSCDVGDDRPQNPPESNRRPADSKEEVFYRID
jgi:hypothetical protein